MQTKMTDSTENKVSTIKSTFETTFYNFFLYNHTQ